MTTLPPSSPAQRLTELSEWMLTARSVLVAYSGGVDSAVVMAVAHRTLGDRSLACIGVSPSYADREYQSAIALAKQLGAQVRIVQTQELRDPRYAQNPSNRCYFCKTELYSKLAEIARAENFAAIADGNNASDIAGDRPGALAAREHAVRSPLAELGITKPLVREIAKLLDLPIWDKPATPCLSSRVPHGTPIVPGLLKQIENAEDVLSSLGFTDFRVRHHGIIARIEVSPDDFPRILQFREQIQAGIIAAGYKFVSLDLAGLQSGSLHRATKGPVQ